MRSIDRQHFIRFVTFFVRQRSLDSEYRSCGGGAERPCAFSQKRFSNPRSSSEGASKGGDEEEKGESRDVTGEGFARKPGQGGEDPFGYSANIAVASSSSNNSD